MPQLTEGKFTYDFPASWKAVKFDDSPFYRKHFQSFAGGTPAVDLVAIDQSDRVIWLIEAKDYRANRREKSIELFLEMSMKVRGTLAGLIAARANASDPNTRTFAMSALRSHKIRCVLHLEQPTNPSKLFPQVIDPKSARDKLRQSLRAVDSHSVVGGRDRLNVVMAWQVI